MCKQLSLLLFFVQQRLDFTESLMAEAHKRKRDPKGAVGFMVSMPLVLALRGHSEA